MMKVTETHGEKMYLEAQDGLDFALRIFHSSFLKSMHWSLRTDDSEWLLPDRLHKTQGDSETQWERQHNFTGLKLLFSFLGGAVMLLVYEYTYSWLQENW